MYNDKNPEFSYLAFTQDGQEEHLLYANDLYNLQLKASLVALSACDSGVGELQRGEGLQSLAQGFYYSGASGIASTLWKINDKPAADIMSGFYKQLSEGATKENALQQAQVAFLKEHKTDALAHPYHWAGFIISGNTAPLVSEDTNTLWYILAIGIVILTVGFVLRKRIKR